MGHGPALRRILAAGAVSVGDRIAALTADPGQWDRPEAIRGMAPLSRELKHTLPDVDTSALDGWFAPLGDRPGTVLH